MAGYFSKLRDYAYKNPNNQEVLLDLLKLASKAINEDKTQGLDYCRQLKDLLWNRLDKRIAIKESYKLIHKVLILESRYSLDSYLIALEWNRPVKERFWQPRRKILLPVVHDLEDLLINDKLDEYFISQPPRTGKLLADDTPILTTNGWKRHGDLKVGDFVYAPNGEKVKVLAVSPKHHTTHTIYFSDHTYIKCHYNHEWFVHDRNAQRNLVRSTKEMIDLGIENNKKGRGHRYRFMLPLQNYIQGKPQDLPVKPYTLGAWLGDGTNTNPYITGDKKDVAILEGIINDGYIIKHSWTNSATGAITTCFEGLRDDLKKIGLCNSRHRNDKYIPDIYLRASIPQRLQLLAGLLDTDGNLRRSEKRYCFTTSDEKLKEDFISLISTFGWRACVVECQPKVSTSGIVGKKPYWVISFNPDLYIPCWLERKQLKEFSKPRRVSIVKIEEQKEEEQERGNCIQVEGGLYLAGKTLKPTHNSTLVLFVLSWQVGMSPELANLYVSNSGTLCNAFYQGLKEIITDTTTYCWKEIFPDVAFDQNSFLNAKETWLEVGRIKRYHSLTCRSIDASLNGACDCNGILISDDLVSGIEEALNPERMHNVWTKVDNNMITRAKESAKIMWIGTRWSIKDPIGVRIEMLQNDPKFAGLRYKVRNLPALNENDESNFDYDYGVGFSTDYYRRRRASFENFGDTASWEAQYQGAPIERSGMVFAPEYLTYYDELPRDSEGKLIPPDRIYAVCDVAFNGSDFLSMPIGFQYGDIIYVEDWVFDNGNKAKTQPKVLQRLMMNKVSSCYFEANNGGEFYADEIKKALAELKYVMNVMSKYAPNTISKNDRIFRCSTDIIANFRFKSTAKRNAEYSMAMRQMFSFTILGKKQHEDACDSLAMMSMARAILFRGASFEVIQKPF